MLNAGMCFWYQHKNLVIKMIEGRKKIFLKEIRLTQERHKIPYFPRLNILNKNSRVWDKIYVCWERTN